VQGRAGCKPQRDNRTCARLRNERSTRLVQIDARQTALIRIFGVDNMYLPNGSVSAVCVQLAENAPGVNARYASVK